MPETAPTVVLARVGWMKYYSGSRSNDERPIGGGSYNKRGRGSEICNFKPIGGKLYGYFQPPARDAHDYGVLNLARIVPGTTTDRIEHVLVIFIATDPTADVGADRERVIAWYRDATVLRTCEDDPTDQRSTVGPSGDKESCLYNVVADETSAVLLPPFRRKHSVPRGKGGMGQANVRYLYDEDGTLTAPSWITKAISYIDSYYGENLLTDPLAELRRAAESELEISAGYESNPKIRKVVEIRAMDVVRKLYEKDGFIVADKSGTDCYDFLCIKSNLEVLVEVKGTRTDGSTISLTPNEVNLPADSKLVVDLCIVHSIDVTEGTNPKAHGGILVRYPNWNPAQHELRPVHYECRLIKKHAAIAGGLSGASGK